MDDPTPGREVQRVGSRRPDVGGFVLAGGRSSRMGSDKALLHLAGEPLISHATAKLRHVASSVSILAGPAPGNPALAEFGPLVFDLHPGCGPAGGIEAALAASPYPWNLIVPVDVPFLPVQLLAWWVERTVADPGSPVRVAFFRADGILHPTVLLVHRDAGPGISEAISRGEYKVARVLESAARSLCSGAVSDSSGDLPALEVVDLPQVAPASSGATVPEASSRLTGDDLGLRSLWFANLNTPAELARAGEHLAAVPPGSDPFAAGR